ncbi:ABC-F family ATP-binding cassette domain-containing protein [Prochlorococcus marinus]|uniref:Lysophospholipase n=1 Tax=Prochlorococcus marinus XMU1408 TaxID=2213228 RepID=A0A318R6Z5_PROMR|nr:ABC-F family ATP-binding cassette domain-containing protein [Prochlorococcus marinus]MBW3041149.1 lysophospholipase [Prochlorococcus marinus str. XMU1408]PYE03747.1 lysophospholipase [Prochlorococcus marinus XMU1408]
MLRLEKISKIYPTGEVLKNISWEIKNGERIGLVGVNGAGKSTQLKIIAGLEEATDGSLITEGDPSIAYLKQEFDVDIARTVREELFEAFQEASDLLHKQKLIQEKMESELASQDSDYLNSLIKELSVIQSKFESINGYDLESKIEKLLPNIGFNQKDAGRLVGDFSGGWQMRIALGKILLQSPDLLLLDEPTNHLDLETIEWLENYLLNQKVAMVIVSHDRSFLDKVCTKIVNTERGQSKSYLGNYTSYIQQRDFEVESTRAAYEKQQKDIQVQKAYIERFRASATRSTQAKSREKLLDKVDKISAPESSLKGPLFKFMDAPRSGKEVLNINDLTHSYEDNILFLGADLEVEPGERIAFLGENGSGKSTLLRLIMGLEEADEGSIELGKYNVFPSYFEQNQAEALELEKTVIETINECVPSWTQTQVRSLLGSFGLINDSVFKEVSQISGGEKARLALALMIIKPSNLLILDEPTNHLDIPSKQMLEKALSDYNGTALIVSHDRYFISKVANKIVEIRDGQLIKYRGDYKYYKEKKIEEKREKEKELKLADLERKRLANREKQRKRKKLRKK